MRLTHCPRCGYDIAALPATHRCPECGLAYDPSIVCLEIAREPVSWKRPVVLSMTMLVITVFAFITVRSVGLPMVFQPVIILGMIAWLTYISIQRIHFAKRDLPYQRLIITPQGYRRVRGRRTGRLRKWHPSHQVYVGNISALSHSLEIRSSNAWSLGMADLVVPLLNDQSRASALKSLIEAYIRNIAAEPANGSRII